MNCEHYRDLLNLYLDGEPAAGAALGEHARQCPDCAALYQSAQRLTHALSRLRPPDAPANLAHAVLCRVRDDHRRRVGLRLRLASVAVAALLLIAIGVRFFGPRWQVKQVVFVAPTAPPTQPVPGEQPPTLRDTVNQAGQAFGQLTARAADETVGQTRSLWPVMKPAALDEWDGAPQFETSTKPLQETGQSAVVAIEPVTSSARRAFDLLLHDLPPMEKPAKPDP